MSDKAKVAKKRGKKPAQKVVRQNPNPPNRIEDTDDEAEYLLTRKPYGFMQSSFWVIMMVHVMVCGDL